MHLCYFKGVVPQNRLQAHFLSCCGMDHWCCSLHGFANVHLSSNTCCNTVDFDGLHFSEFWNPMIRCCLAFESSAISKQGNTSLLPRHSKSPIWSKFKLFSGSLKKCKNRQTNKQTKQFLHSSIHCQQKPHKWSPVFE